MINSAIFDESTNDIMARLNPTPAYPQVYSPSSPAQSNNVMNSRVKDLLKNRVSAPIGEKQDVVKKNMLQVIKETRSVASKSVNVRDVGEKARYVDGIKEALNIMESYMQSDKDCYAIIEDIKSVIESNMKTYESIIADSKSFYAGVVSSLMNFLESFIDEIKAQEIAQTNVNTNVTRDINTPDHLMPESIRGNFISKRLKNLALFGENSKK